MTSPGATMRLDNAIGRACRTILCVVGLLVAPGTAPTARSQEEPPVDPFGDSLDAGAAVRLGTVRYRLSDWSKRGLGFAANDRTLVVASEDGTVTFLDAPSGRLITAVTEAGQSIIAAHFGSDRRSAFTLHQWVDPEKNEQSQFFKRWDLGTRSVVATVPVDLPEPTSRS